MQLIWGMNKVNYGLVLCFIILIMVPSAMIAGVRYLLVGISRYEDPRIEALQYSVNDVTYIRQVLNLSGYDKSTVTILTDHDATWMNLRKALFAASGPQDTLVFYFSGHGYHRLVGQRFHQMIALYDSAPDNPGSCLFEDELFLWLTKTHYERKILFFDCCFPPDFSYRKDETDAPGSDHPGIVVLSATSPEKKTWEIPMLKHSVFTYILGNGLKGLADINRDGQIMIPELAEFIREQSAIMQNTPKNPDIPVIAGDRAMIDSTGFRYRPNAGRLGIVMARDGGYGLVDLGRLAGVSDFMQFYNDRNGQSFKPVQVYPLFTQLALDSTINPGDLLLPTQDESPGELILDVVPWAIVELNGKPYGYSPVRIKPLYSGEYVLKLSHPERGTQTRTIILAPGEIKRLKVKL